MSKHIAITGEGIVCAIGNNKPSVLQSLRDGNTGIGPMRYLQSCHHELPVGEVKLSNEEMQQQLGLPSDTIVSRTTLMGMMAVRQALEDACISRETNRSLRIVLISGTTVAGMDVTERYFKEIQQADRHLECLRQHSAGSCTRAIAEHFALFSEYTTISTACSSAANALMLGARLIEDGQADMVVAGGTEALSVFHLNGFNSLMILDKEQCRPFDATRAGLNLGEGAAFVVLESAASAHSRRVPIHGYLNGYGNACDAFHQTASSENGEGAYLAMTAAIGMAGLKPSDIQYVNAHGTGTPNNDQSESVALQRVFGRDLPLISSTKSFTGHTTSASGAIEAVVCLLALQHQFVPANLGWQHPMENGIVPTTGMAACPLKHVVCNAFGFGGNDSSLVLSAIPSEKETAASRVSDADIREVARVEVNTEEELAEIRNYVKPLEARRMGRMMKGSLLASLKALEAAGIDCPDAIVTGTALGCLENSELLLLQLAEEGEAMLKPTYFMQSTHNTISSNIAIRTHCHGYNITYTQDEQSLDWALRDARLLLKSGKYKNVLVGCHDEATPLFNALMQRLGRKEQPSIHSIAIVLSCGK